MRKGVLTFVFIWCLEGGDFVIEGKILKNDAVVNLAEDLAQNTELNSFTFENNKIAE